LDQIDQHRGFRHRGHLNWARSEPGGAFPSRL
jgi:hypothetical protein